MLLSLASLLVLQFSRVGLASGGVWTPRILGDGRAVPRAGIDPRIQRRGVSDTLYLQTSVTCDFPLTTGQWEVSIPSGLTLLSGELRGTTLQPGPQANYARSLALVRCDEFGTFEITSRVKAEKDSMTWASMEYRTRIRVTPESLVVIARVEHESYRERIVVEGVHYGLCMLDAIPLDPGEDEQVGRVEPFDGRAEAPPVLQKHSAVRAASAMAGVAVEIPIRVAVDRSGHVKAAGLSGLDYRVPTPDEQAALEAARKWRFAPTMSKGRPVTALYLIRVPVKVAEGP